MSADSTGFNGPLIFFSFSYVFKHHRLIIIKFQRPITTFFSTFWRFWASWVCSELKLSRLKTCWIPLKAFNGFQRLLKIAFLIKSLFEDRGQVIGNFKGPLNPLNKLNGFHRVLNTPFNGVLALLFLILWCFNLLWRVLFCWQKSINVTYLLNAGKLIGFSFVTQLIWPFGFGCRAWETGSPAAIIPNTTTT